MNKALTIQSAPLPTSYVDARAALAKCEQVDECQSWADKSAALASYAKQAKDDFLLIKARRIQLRAIERGGELLAQIKAAKGGDRRSKEGRPPIESRKAAADAAGISPDQAKTMLRVVNVPAEERDRLIESPNPPTVSELAERGIKPRPVKPEPYKQEWADWVFAVKRLRDTPECGLEVLAKRDGGLTVDRLLADARAAKENVQRWINVLEDQQ